MNSVYVYGLIVPHDSSPADAKIKFVLTPGLLYTKILNNSVLCLVKHELLVHSGPSPNLCGKIAIRFEMKIFKQIQ